MMRAIASMMLVIWGLLGVGCVGYTIRPPQQVAEPVAVHIVDYGDTSRLWLPEDSGGFTEWGYGDWRWYANDKKSLLYGSIVFIWPTAGTIGKHGRDSGPWDAEGGLLPDLVGYATEVHTFDVEMSSMRDLRTNLHERYESQIESELQNKRRKMTFVKDDTSYWLGHQSSSVMADWAEELGCRVSGFSLRANYDLKAPGTTVTLETNE
ncbi:MAG: hypothetical protein ED559_10370 [Phycisphaera sp.]|nr:MAG: hypothetical protein ED559_10370 [Phycisphaera sp.]